MWAYESTFYQVYPIGMLGAPRVNESVNGEFNVVNRLSKFNETWINHIKNMGADAIYFCPVFESDSHGYNTRDYRRIDRRLGTNNDFKDLVTRLHKAGIRVVIDGVFNHVGRGFWAFLDLLEKRENSKYKDWFFIDFNGNSNYNDGLYYEGWEGCYDLVKLNLRNEEVVRYLLDTIKFWIDEFDIDGLRLDVAYLLDRNFLRRIRAFTDSYRQDFFLLGEILGGDYKTIMGDDMCHSATNYECYKGIYSALNSQNLFEIMHSLKRQFGSDSWALYRDKHLLSFVDNHDVTRAASIVDKEDYIVLMYAFIFTMPGIPCVYYGSEWGIKGDKKDGDDSLRPAIETPEWNHITDTIKTFSAFRKNFKEMIYGDFKDILITNKQCAFERSLNGATCICLFNADDKEYTFNIRGKDYILDSYTAQVIKI